MNYLVDGHNLIGKMPGIALDDPDDEAKLVMVLRRYATANRRRNIIVIFDRGVYGHPVRLDGYGITCYFAQSPQDADTQIIRRIAQIERTSDWRVVTSDRRVARAAQARKVRVISSTEFAATLLASPHIKIDPNEEKPREVRLSPAEVEEWLRLFGEPVDQPPEDEDVMPPEPGPLKQPKRYVQKRRVRKR